MRALLPDPPPAGVAALLERRKRRGQDRHDEVWGGMLHMAPSPSYRHSVLAADVISVLKAYAGAAGLTASLDFNLGDSVDDFRVPDAGLHRPGAAEVWLPTAALVVEILSPDDETWEKLSFYAAHNVDELLVIDPEARSVDWRALESGRYKPIERSRLIELSAVELSRHIDWP
ncbi:MAG: Uma2 family endonuclease [Solirubrobacteraceae bacterium]